MSQAKTRKEIESNLIAKAWKDDSFKQQLMNNPKSAIAEAGISLPESIEVKVIEETANTFYLVIPRQPSQEKELSEADLQSVAGGAKIKGSVNTPFGDASARGDY